MAKAFEAEILESFGELARRGFIERRLRSIHWCPTDRTALALAEIEYQEDPAHSVIVRFPLRRDPKGALARHADLQALAWTTTPWFREPGLMVDPAAEYVVVRAAGSPAGGARGCRARRRRRGRSAVEALKGRDHGAVFEGRGNDHRWWTARPMGASRTAPGSHTARVTAARLRGRAPRGA
jgi:isoleucyl-tRNA synthetase